MKEILKHVPGFRTNRKWKKVIAIIGYLFMILILFMSEGVTFGDKMVTFVERLLFLSVPFVLIANIGNIRNKLPLYKSKKKGNTVIGTILTIIFVSIILASMPNLYSPQFKQEKLIAAAKQKADAKTKSDAKDKAEAKLIADEKIKTDAQIKNEAKLKADAKIKSDAKIKADAKLTADEKIKADAKAKTAAKLIADAKIKADAKAKIAAELKMDTIIKAKAIAKSKADAKAIQDKKIAAAKAAKNAATAKKVKYQAWIDGQFSAWDGSHTYLVDLVKENLNDDTSFKQVKTTYVDKGTYLIVYMTYRAKNGFGALILQNVTAKADYKTNSIKIISQNN